MKTKVMNEHLVVKVGNGYEEIQDFVANYGPTEEHKIRTKLERGEDPFSSEDESA